MTSCRSTSESIVSIQGEADLLSLHAHFPSRLYHISLSRHQLSCCSLDILPCHPPGRTSFCTPFCSGPPTLPSTHTYLLTRPLHSTLLRIRFYSPDYSNHVLHTPPLQQEYRHPRCPCLHKNSSEIKTRLRHPSYNLFNQAVQGG